MKDLLTNSGFSITQSLDNINEPVYDNNEMDFPSPVEVSRGTRPDLTTDDTSIEASDSVPTKEIIKTCFARFCFKSRNFIISFLLIVILAISNIYMPIYTMNMVSVGSDPYVAMVNNAMWFPVVIFTITALMKLVYDHSISFRPLGSWKHLLIAGLSLTMAAVFAVFSNLFKRTPAYLQAILGCVSIPFTIMIRRIVLKKGLSLRRLICTAVIVAGVFVSAVPKIWNMDGTNGSGDINETDSLAERILWPAAFCIAFLPLALMNVIAERSVKEGKTHVLNFVFWVYIVHVSTIWLTFWTDLIPRFGMASSIDDFRAHLYDGVSCSYSTEQQCRSLLSKSWICILSICLSIALQFLLIQKSEGAIFAVVVQTLITPIVAIFWTLFKYDTKNDKIYWKPVFNKTTAFMIGGLVILVPSVFIYNYLSLKDEQKENNQINEQNEEKKEDGHNDLQGITNISFETKL